MRHRAWLGVVLAAAPLAPGATPKAHQGSGNLQAALAEAKALETEGQYDQAIQQYRELLRRFSDSTEIRQGLAKDLAITGHCEDAASLRPGSPDSPQVRGERETIVGTCYFRKNDLKTSFLHLKKAVELAPNNKQAALFLGRAYASAGQAEEGIRTLKAFEARRGEDADALYWIGVFYDQLAEQTYQGMAKSHPDSYLVLETQGDQLLQQQKYDDALKAYGKALHAAPDAPGLHFDLGNTYWRMAKLDQAASELEAELRLNPGHAQAHYELGDIAVKRGDVEKGLPLLKRALALDPSLVEAHRSLGRAFLAEQRYAEAAREFAVVARAEPSDHTIHALLASVYKRMGRTQDAEDETRKYDDLVKNRMSDLGRKESEQKRDAEPIVPAPNN